MMAAQDGASGARPVALRASELGAVFSVAILGALVNAHITSGLRARLHHLGIPSFFQGVVISAVDHGGVPSGGNSPAGAERTYGAIVGKVIDSAYSAFRDGVDATLLTAGIVLLVLTPVAWLALRRYPDQPRDG